MLGGTLGFSPTNSVSPRRVCGHSPASASRLRLVISSPSQELRCVSEIDIQILFKQLKLAKGRLRGKTASSCQATVCCGDCDFSVLGQETAGGVVGSQRQDIQAAADDSASEAGGDTILQKGQANREARESREALPSQDKQHIN